jgi:hypothetical protein
MTGHRKSGGGPFALNKTRKTNMKFLTQITTAQCHGFLSLSAFLLLALALTGCGGGGGGGVTPPTAIVPTISTAPAAISVIEGQPATFSVTATGSAPLGYQWQRSTDGGNTWSNAPGAATAPSYSKVAPALADNGALYRVVVTNSAGSVTSDSALLSVSAVPSVPVIDTQPAAATVTAGQAATFTVTATSSLPLSYQWQQSANSGNTWSNVDGATASSYITAVTILADNGALYRIVVTNSADSVTSDPALLSVSAAPTPPVIGTQPAAATVTEGQVAIFSVTATGSAPLSYQWQQSGNNGSTWSNAPGAATASSYTTAATTNTADNGALYRVVVTNSAGNIASETALLTVNSTPPASVERLINATVTDASITAQPSTGEAPHVVINPSPAVTAAGKLLVFLPGTQGVPTQYSYLLRAGASRGYHALGLNYVNQQAMGGLCLTSSDTDCYWKARNVVINGGGTPVPSQAAVSVADSIINRLNKLLVYMNTTRPTEGWGQFLKSDNTVIWSKVILAGHSQGGGHVGVLAKTVFLSRAVYFSSPEDWRGLIGVGSPANWSAKPNVTPASWQYGFGADLDTLVPNAHAFAHWDNLQLSKPNTGPVLVDGLPAPFYNSHQLHTALNFNPASQAGSVSLSQHGITVLNTATPLDGDNKPLFDTNGVWAYLCFQ